MIEETRVPSPELLAAREQLLDGIAAAGKIGGTTKKRDKEVIVGGLHVSMREINIEAAKQVAEKRRAAWEKERARLDAMVADAVATKTNLPNNHWVDEHRAKALYGSALLFLEAISEP